MQGSFSKSCITSAPSLRFEPHIGTFGEADHWIANSLAAIGALVRLRARVVGDRVDPQVFQLEIADRPEAVAKLHRLLARSDRGSVWLNEYLREICDRLGSALALAPPSFSVICSSEHLVPFNMALPLGLITAELFSNSLKYAHPAGLPAKISVSCSCTPADKLMLTYEDDGVGFPETFDVSHEGHLGMQFIQRLSERLRGTYKWLSDPLGLRFEIVVPMRNAFQFDTRARQRSPTTKDKG
jgi:two-component sensor histidine kinase